MHPWGVWHSGILEGGVTVRRLRMGQPIIWGNLVFNLEVGLPCHFHASLGSEAGMGRVEIIHSVQGFATSGSLRRSTNPFPTGSPD